MSTPKFSSRTDTAFCLGCGYSLRNLPSQKCPECGRPFDPADPCSMSLGHPLRPWQRWLLRPTGWPMIALALLGSAGLIYLSRWPRLSPEPPLVLLDEFHWPRPYTMPPTAMDVVFYVAVALWAAFVAWTVLWQFARLLLVPRVGRRGNVWGVDTRRRHRAVLAAAMLSIFFMIFGWEQRVGRRWIARVMAPASQSPWPGRFGPRGDLWRESPVTLSLEQGRAALSHLIVDLPPSNARFGALRMLVEGTGRAALPSLIHAAATETDENLLAWELRLIALFRERDTAPLLIGYLRDPRPAVRAAAADAVGILRTPSYSINLPDGFFLADPLALDTSPPIRVGGIVATARSERSMSFNGGWEAHELLDDPPIPLESSVRTALESMMLNGATADEREAAARALVAWPPDKYRFRVAEWGVWIDSRGRMALAQSVLDEIPPFVHRMGNPISSFGPYILAPSQVAKPIAHLTSDVSLAVDIEVQIREGRPWFAFPKPDDFGVGVWRDSQSSRLMGVAGRPGLVPGSVRGPRRQQPATQPDDDDFESPPIASMPDCREGYPWLLPHHRLYPEIGMGTAPIFRLGVHWQSIIVAPARLPWMAPPVMPADARFRWWARLRDVPSCWIASRGEAERFLYYDGPTRSMVPMSIALEDSGRRIRLTTNRQVPAGFHIPDTVKNIFRGMEPTLQPDLPEHEGLYIEVHSGQVRAHAMEITSDCTVPLSLDPALTGESAVSARLREMLLRYGLSGPEADGLIAAWTPQFFRAEGRRFILRMSPAEYARQCPMQVRPTPTEVVRLGLVLTEFDPKLPATTRPTAR